jgi:hypothetical protein
MLFHFTKDKNSFPYTIRIPWRMDDTINSWNDICAWAVEHYGLPGDKFITHPTEDYMDFMFRNEEDAIHFSLVCE